MSYRDPGCARPARTLFARLGAIQYAVGRIDMRPNAGVEVEP